MYLIQKPWKMYTRTNPQERTTLVILKLTSDERPYNNLEKTFVSLPFQKIGGVRPYSRDTMRNTATRDFYKDMNDIVKDRKTREDFYKEIKGKIN
jgi:hypothetical protein